MLIIFGLKIIQSVLINIWGIYVLSLIYHVGEKIVIDLFPNFQEYCYGYLYIMNQIYARRILKVWKLI
jgi:hypothetical protein